MSIDVLTLELNRLKSECKRLSDILDENIKAEVDNVNERLNQIKLDKKDEMSKEDIMKLYKDGTTCNIIYMATSTRIDMPNVYKIGITKCKSAREKTADISIIYEREVSFIMSKDIEEEVHNRLKSRRVSMPLGIEGRGEYFYGDIQIFKEAIDNAVDNLNSGDTHDAKWYFNKKWMKKGYRVNKKPLTQ